MVSIAVNEICSADPLRNFVIGGMLHGNLQTSAALDPGIQVSKLLTDSPMEIELLYNLGDRKVAMMQSANRSTG